MRSTLIDNILIVLGFFFPCKFLIVFEAFNQENKEKTVPRRHYSLIKSKRFRFPTSSLRMGGFISISDIVE